MSWMKLQYVQILHILLKDGKTYQVQFYNLDVILAVGYRANSKQAIAFRKWATKTLREHITKGYTINKKAFLKTSINS